jgi:two-component system LytT family response regulator
MTTCVIIEDDQLSRGLLTKLIEIYFSDELKLLGSVGTVKDGLALIRKKSPELIFLDIELPDENGFGIYNYFPNPDFSVIFTTSNPNYAISAIKHMAVDYLLKPINQIDLSAAMIRFEKRKSLLKQSNDSVKMLVDNLKMGTSFQEKIALPTCDGFQVFPFNEILYCQASENYSYVFTITNESFLVTRTLKNLEEILPSYFFRIHKSVLLNINYIKYFSRKEGFIVTLETGQKFEVATRRYEDFINQLVKKHSITNREANLTELK